MTGWAIILILSMAGIVVILLRRLPNAVKTTLRTPESTNLNSVALVDIKTPVVSASINPVEKTVSSSESGIDELASSKFAELATTELIDRGQAAFAGHEYPRAREIYAVLVARARDAKWLTRLGVANMELERFREARDAFRSALRFGEVASRHANLGMAEFALGHRVTAIGHLRKAIALSPNTKRYQELLESIESNG